MAKEIKMPQLSDTMDSGKILTWLKNEGDQITRGDIIAEVETDKANLEIESFDTGVLLKISIPANSTAKVGEVIAIIGQAGELVANSTPIATPVAPVVETTPKVEEAPVSSNAPIQDNNPSISGDRLKVSPLAKKIAKENNIDLNSVHGTGPNGRIVRKDLEGSSCCQDTSSCSSPTPVITTAPVVSTAIENKSITSTPKAVTGGNYSELSKMRATIAKRMQESMQVSPHFYMTTVINMGEAKKLREGLKVKENFRGLSLNHFIIKATAYALSKEPAVNAAMHGEQLYQPSQINVGIITAIEGGLLIPVLKEVDQMKLMDVAFETRAAISRARAGRPTSADLSGGTFSISNMGMYDVENFTAIINPGQGGILAVSGMKEKPIVENGEIKIGLEMKVTLSVDHRIIDGVTAAQFLAHLKEALEFPALLLV